MRKSKTILITGCSSGIGLDAANTLAQRGYRVFATVRNEDDCKHLEHPNIKTFCLDITDYKKIDKMLETIFLETKGSLDALFNNAAYGQVGAIEDITTDILKQQFETNVFAWHYLTNKILPVMHKQGYGRIIQNSSVLGLVSMPFRGPYNASKYAIEGLTDTLRLELMDSKIKISLIEPGPIATRFRENALDKLKANVDMKSSRYSQIYVQQIERLGKDIANKFTLPANAVTEKLILALEAKEPSPRYYVTFPTYLFGLLKRILSTKLLDKLLVKG